MTDAIHDLRATADDLAADAERLREIEERKVTLASDDPALLDLSTEAEALSREMAAKASVQRELAEEVVGDEAAPAADQA